MKNLKLISVVLVLLCFVNSLKAQTEKGNILLGAETKFDLGIMNTKWKTDGSDGDHGKSTNLDFYPQIGYFVADGLALGGEVLIMYSAEKDDDYEYSTTSIAVAPFLRYYFGKTNVKPYLDGGAGFGKVKTKYDYSGNSNEYSDGVFVYGVGGGLGIFLNEKVSIDMGIYYRSSSTKPKEDNEENYREITSGIGLGIGIVVVL